jgi:hypothetical protein
MIYRSGENEFEKAFHVTLLSLCANGIVARKLSACIYGSARTGGFDGQALCFRLGEDRGSLKVILVAAFGAPRVS